MKARKVTNAKSKKDFKLYGKYGNSLNLTAKPTRGGYRL